MINYTQLNDTIVALATPAGIGAIGVIRLSGKEAISLANTIFKGKNLEKQKSHTLHFGHIIDDDNNKVIDEVLVSLFVAPHSYTKENTIEISCHGSPYILQQIIQLCIRKGARMAQPGEFTMRAFLNGSLDLSQAEAVADLIASSSEGAHNIAIRQLRGGFSNDIKRLRAELIDFASLIELELDFSEEDVEFANRAQLRKLILEINIYIKTLLDSFVLGNAIKNGVNTVIVGRPNAGKSTLLNALLNESRAIVSEIAGTTRDTIEEVLNIRGIQFRLIDTAGIREATETIEAIGVQKTMEKINQSALLVYVADATTMSLDEINNEIQNLISVDNYLQAVLVVLNKKDLVVELAKLEEDAKLVFEKHYDYCFISAKDGANTDSINLLKNQLYDAVSLGNISNESVVVSNARHYEALQKAQKHLNDVILGLDNNITSDFIAMDIRSALTYLGDILGEVTSDDLLGNIFSRFCIGK